MALKMEIGKYSNPFLTLSGRTHRVKNAMGKNRGTKVTSAIPKMSIRISCLILCHPYSFNFKLQTFNFELIYIPIPEARRAVRMIYQFPGNAHLKKSEDIPAITMI